MHIVRLQQHLLRPYSVSALVSDSAALIPTADSKAALGPGRAIAASAASGNPVVLASAKSTKADAGAGTPPDYKQPARAIAAAAGQSIASPGPRSQNLPGT